MLHWCQQEGGNRWPRGGLPEGSPRPFPASSTWLLSGLGALHTAGPIPNLTVGVIQKEGPCEVSGDCRRPAGDRRVDGCRGGQKGTLRENGTEQDWCARRPREDGPREQGASLSFPKEGACVPRPWGRTEGCSAGAGRLHGPVSCGRTSWRETGRRGGGVQLRGEGQG